MKKNIWVCGFIGGLIAALWGVAGEAVLSNSLSLNMRMIFGYASMILAFSLIFVAIKNYRDHYNNGVVSIARALRIGLLITLVASTVYVMVWMIYSSYFLPDFGDKYQAQVVAELKARGTSPAVIQKQAAELAATMKQYNSSPFFKIMFTYLEIVPVGIVISLIAALILKKYKTESTTINI